MILSKSLLLKALGGIAAIGGGAVTVVVGKKIGLFGESIDPALKNLIEKVNLSCNSENICTQISGQTTNIKQDSTLDGKTLTTSTSGTGKIKVYKLSGENTGYKDNFKFVIEGGDITITGETDKKLEEFETYEIKEEGTDPSKKWYFSRKSKSEDEIKRLLGLPSSDSSCTLPTSENTPTTCSSIDATKLKAINFEGKGTDGATIENSGSATLKIDKITTDTTTFPLGYKFTFETDNNITIPKKINNENISIKKKTNTEFKIKVTPSSDTTPVSLSLEKAWTAKSLGEKVGLVCEESNNNEKKCTFKDGSINVNNVNNSNGKIDEAKVKEGSTDKKLKYEEDQEGHNQGIKFTVEGDAAIELTKEDNSTTLSIENNNASYEIKKDNSDSKWYLTKYTASN